MDDKLFYLFVCHFLDKTDVEYYKRVLRQFFRGPGCRAVRKYALQRILYVPIRQADGHYMFYVWCGEKGYDWPLPNSDDYVRVETGWIKWYNHKKPNVSFLPVRPMSVRPEIPEEIMRLRLKELRSNFYLKMT